MRKRVALKVLRAHLGIGCGGLGSGGRSKATRRRAFDKFGATHIFVQCGEATLVRTKGEGAARRFVAIRKIGNVTLWSSLAWKTDLT